jgi:16S rRNA (guanine966-N2)-methyltransferase
MRIIGGEARGRRLRAPRGAATRPTADRVREALFDLIGEVTGLRVLDLFAGTGALGLEALSRGAARAVLVDQAEAAVRVMRANIDALGYGARARVLRQDVGRALRRLADGSERFDLVFLDPPYGTTQGELALGELGSGELIGSGALVVAEHDRRRELAAGYGILGLCDRRRYGDTELSIYQGGAAGAPPATA